MNPQPGLIEAVSDGDLTRTRALLSSGSTPNCFDAEGRTPLILAIQSAGLVVPVARQRRGFFARLLFGRAESPPQSSGDTDMIRALLEAGARHDLKSFNDWAPLMHAARWGNVGACEALLAAGADPDLQNFKGRTALMIAAYHLHEAALALLIERGTRHDQADADGRTAVDFLRSRARDRAQIERCGRLLRRAGVKPGRGGRSGLLWWLKTLPGLRQVTATVRYIRRLAKHFTEDELTQARNPPLESRRFLIAASLVSLFSVCLLHWSLGVLLVVVAGAGLLLYAFPSILQLFYLLLTPRSRKASANVGDSDPGSAPPAGTGQLDAVSNFMRLGWGSLTDMVRAREVRLRHVGSHLASIGLAAGIVLTVVSLGGQRTGQPTLDSVFGPVVDLGQRLKKPIEGHEAWLWGTNTFLPLAIVLIALALERSLRNGRLRKHQSRKDEVAGEINATLAEQTSRQGSETEAFVLYLRTFGVTGKLSLGGVDFETAIAYNLAPMLPMIALGDPGEAVGAGRILTTDEHWKQEILRLVEHSSLIMLIPSSREGTMWEIATLKETNYFDKTIFAMPPEVPFDGGSYSSDWNEAAAALASWGLEIPPHYRDGLLFKLGADGRFLEHAPLQAEQFLVELQLASSGGEGDDGEGGDDIDEDGGDDADGDGDGDGDGGGGGNGGGDGGSDGGGGDGGG